MGQILHRCATTTEAIRRAIQNSQASLRELANQPFGFVALLGLIALAGMIMRNAANSGRSDRNGRQSRIDPPGCEKK